MARHTSWRVGGTADRYFSPHDLAGLRAFLRGLPEQEPLTWVGLGSNLLVRDGGLRGTVIAPGGGLDGLTRQHGNQVRAEAGVYCAHVARFCAGEGLVGVEFLAGIPGTFGGALAMNAGAFGSETWERVLEVETVDHAGHVRVRSREDFAVSYRSVDGWPGEWFVAATLSLEAGDGDASRQRIRDLLHRRGETQPTGQPSCGSVFRNPPGDHAARLIEVSGLKGLRRGGAQVSEKHANFIVNTGTATAADIEGLIAEVARRVEAAQGVRLHPEVHIIGERMP